MGTGFRSAPFYFVLPVPTHFEMNQSQRLLEEEGKKYVLCWRTHYVIEIDPSSSFLGGI
jgi:hypothetical protein